MDFAQSSKRLVGKVSNRSEMLFDRTFFEREVTLVARELLGAYLHRRIDGVEFIGRIVETEAYHQNDAASHSFRGMTERNKIMFGKAGFAYVYFTYGMHYCANVVTGKEGSASAVLIRALEPAGGTKEMYSRRKRARCDRDLLSGPAKLCQAFKITKEQNGTDLLMSHELFLTQGVVTKVEKVGVSSRVGIRVAMQKQWRYFIKDNPFVSTGKPSE